MDVQIDDNMDGDVVGGAKKEAGGNLVEGNQNTTIVNNSCPPGRCWQKQSGEPVWNRKIETSQFMILLSILAVLVAWYVF